MKEMTNKQMQSFINLFKLCVELDDVSKEWHELNMKTVDNYAIKQQKLLDRGMRIIYNIYDSLKNGLKNLFPEQQEEIKKFNNYLNNELPVITEHKKYTINDKNPKFIELIGSQRTIENHPQNIQLKNFLVLYKLYVHFVNFIELKTLVEGFMIKRLDSMTNKEKCMHIVLDPDNQSYLEQIKYKNNIEK